MEVIEEVGADEEAVVAEPEDGGEDDGGCGHAEEGAETISGACPERPEDGREKEEGGGLGEDHEGNEEAESEERCGVAEGGAERGGCCSLLFSSLLLSSLLLGACVGGGEEGKEREQDQKGFEDGKTGEGVAERTDGEQEDGNCGGQSWSCGVAALGGPSTEKEIRGEDDEAEDPDGQGAGGDKADSGEVKEGGFEKGQDGEGGGGVEVSGNVPVAALEVTDGGVAIPAFVGVLGPVHPGGVVGEVGAEVKGVQEEEDEGAQKKKSLQGFEEERRVWTRERHGYRRVKRTFELRVEDITKMLLGGSMCCAARDSMLPKKRCRGELNDDWSSLLELWHRLVF
jgi:hypothetical protein